MEESWFGREIEKKPTEDFDNSDTLKKGKIGESIIVKGPTPTQIVEEDEIDDEDVKPVSVPKLVEDDVDADLNIDRPPAPRPAGNDVSVELNVHNISANKNDTSRVVVQQPPPPKEPKLDPNAKMTKKVFVLNLAGVIIGLVTSLVILFCLYRSYRSFKKDYFPFEAIKEIWAKDTIKDIKLSINGKCPSEAFTPLLQSDWPGLAQGCDCTSNNGNLAKTVLTSVCTSDQKTKGCTDSPATDGRTLNKWRNTEFLCVERNKDTNMEKMVLNSDPAAKCKSGFKMCPLEPKNPEGKESFSWAMCLPDNKDSPNYVASCPISLMNVSACTKNPDTNCFTDAPANKVELGNSLCLWMTNKCGRGPISTLALGETGICRHYDQPQIDANHTEFALIKKPRATCLQNPDIEKVDSQPQEDVLRQNGAVLNQVTAYTTSIKTYNYSLYALYYTKWSWPHRNSEDIYLVFNNKVLIERLEQHHWNALVFFSFYVIICLFISPPLFYYESQHSDLYRYNRILLCAKYSVLWFFKITTVPVILLIMKMNNDIYKKFKQYGSAEFSNTFENNKMHELADSLERGVHKYDRFALWVACAVIVIDLILMALVCLTEEQKIHTEDLEVDMNESLTDGIELRVQ